MKYRVLTVNREFGSGGGRIAQTIAGRLGWKLLDRDIIDAIAYAAHVDTIIEEAWSEGNCVIVGRGAQCVLQHKPDVFHAFVYAPLRDRILRLRSRLEKGANIEERIRTVDGERAKYLQEYFGKNWCNMHLYDLMISSRENEESTAKVILQAMTGEA